jgi:hypothetical protein
MWIKTKCPVSGCDYECGHSLSRLSEDNEELQFAERVALADSLRNEHPNHPKTKRAES